MPQSPSYTSVEGVSSIGVVGARRISNREALQVPRAARAFTALRGGGCAGPGWSAARTVNAVVLRYQAARSISGVHLPWRARLFIVMRRANACCALDAFS